MKRAGGRIIVRLLFCFFLLAALVGCTGQSSKNRFLLAERLWHEGKYQASVTEYERVMQKEEASDLGLQAAYRAGLTETLFLNEHLAAIRKFNRVIDLKRNSPLAHEASKQIGEILYGRLEQHEQAVAHYSKLLEMYPNDPELPEWLFRIGKGQFHLLKFDDSIATYQNLLRRFPEAASAEKASYEIAVSFETKAHQQDRTLGNSGPVFKQAVTQFQAFLKAYPESELATQAKFEMASCFEELDQLEQARQVYEEIRTTYPIPRVVAGRIQRIDQKKPKKSQP